jgi:C1A family cysteine protease
MSCLVCPVHWQWCSHHLYETPSSLPSGLTQQLTQQLHVASLDDTGLSNTCWEACCVTCWTLRSTSKTNRSSTVYRHSADFVPLPGSVNWQGSGAVGPVKDQGVCGSCWSFSATQVLSSAVWFSTASYVSFSEQQLLDCSWGYGENHACDGGDPDLAIKVCSGLLEAQPSHCAASRCSCL